MKHLGRRAEHKLRSMLPGYEPPAPPPEVEIDRALLPWRDAVDEPEHFTMGVGSYGRPVVHVFRGDHNAVHIGRYCSIAPEVEFMVGGNHRTDWVTTWPGRELLELQGAYESGHPCSKGDITVGNDVWIGTQVLVLSGVTVGDGAVLGARAVVSSDVPPYAIVAGNPARVIRTRFSDDVVERLLALRWWDWSIDIVEERIGDLCADPLAFLDRYEAAPSVISIPADDHDDLSANGP